jgi:hypothetical protein
VVSIVYRKSELSIQPLQETSPPLLVPVHQHFCVASSTENVAGLFELAPQLSVVENLASRCNDDLTVFVCEGLPTGRI